MPAGDTRKARWSAVAVIVICLTVTIIGFASMAEAQTGWSGVVTNVSAPVATARASLQPAIAVQANGNAYAIWNGEATIEVARYVAATDSWDDPVALAGPGLFGPPELAVDGFGNAFFLVTRYAFAGSALAQIQVVRYAAASATISTTTLSSNGFAPVSAKIVTTAAGNAMALWEESTGIHAARYDNASATWASPVRISADGAHYPVLALDGLNDVTAVWLRFQSSGSTIVQATRFDSSTLTWGAANDLSEPSQETWLPGLAADAAGNVTALWAQSNGFHTIVQAARFVKSANTWSSVIDLSASGADAEYPVVAADPAGNVIALWFRCLVEDSCTIVQTARFDGASASWGPAVDFTFASGGVYPEPSVQMDATGNAIALWGLTRADGDVQLQAARYTALTNQWSPSVELSAAGQAAYDPHIGFDAAGNAVAVWSQRAGGFVAIQSTRWIQQPPVAPDPPRDLVVSSVTGNTVTLVWKAPAASTPTGYVLEGGLSPGGVLASIPTESTSTSFTFNAPTGVFFARLHAVSGDLRSGASNEIQLVVNVPLPPSAPAALLGLVNGSTLALSWTNTFQGGAPSALQLNVTGAQTANIPLSVSDAVSFNGVPGGTYTFTLMASNASGVSPPSNPVTLTFPDSCSGPPGVPTYFAVAKSGSSLTLTWHPPVSGAAATSYVIHASGALTGSLPTFTRSLSGTVGPGTYALSVVAANECGTSAPTDVITVVVP